MHILKLRCQCLYNIMKSLVNHTGQSFMTHWDKNMDTWETEVNFPCLGQLNYLLAKNP